MPCLIAVFLMLEYPPPGSGVGKVAAKLPKMDFVIGSAPAGEGTLLAGTVYVLIFWRDSRACSKCLPKLERLKRHCAAITDKVHFVLISSDTLSTLRNFAKKWEGQVTMPLCHDAANEAAAAYLGEHGVLALPHAFIVDVTGKIVWHGNANSKHMTRAMQPAMLQLKDGVAQGRKSN